MVPDDLITSRRPLPTQGIDNFISAARHAEQLKVRQPQDSRTDSVVTRLGDQAVAAQQNARQLPPWITSSGFGSTVTGDNVHSQLRSPTAGSGAAQELGDHIFQSSVVPSQSWETIEPRSLGMVSSKNTRSDAQYQGKSKSSVGNKKRQRVTNGEVSGPIDEQTQLEMAPSTPDGKRSKVQH